MSSDQFVRKNIFAALACLAVAALLLAAPGPAGAAIMIHDALAATPVQGPQGGAALPNGPNTLVTSAGTLAYTVTSGASVLVVEFGMWADNAAQTPIFTWDGQTMTQAYQTFSTNNTHQYADVYYLDNPNVGSYTLTCSESSQFLTRGIGFAAFTLSGVAPGAPIVGGTDTTSGSSSAVTLSSTAANSYAVVAYGARLGGAATMRLTSTAGSATQLWGGGDSGNATAIGGGDVSGIPVGSITITGSVAGSSGNRNEIAAAIFAPSLTGTYTWTGAASGAGGKVWTTQSSPLNWNLATSSGTSSAAYADNSPVIFGNTGQNFAISITGTAVNPASVTFTGTQAYTFNEAGGGYPYNTGAPIAGPATVTLSGSNNVLFGTPNTYLGITTINGGQLALDDPNAIQNSTAVVNTTNGLAFSPDINYTNLLIANSASGGMINIGGLSGSGSLALADTGSGAVLLAVGGNGQSNTFSGTILASSGTLQKVGNGSLTLSGTNLATGGIIISAGTLAATQSAALGDPVALPGVNIGNGATFEASGTFATSQPLTIGGSNTSTIVVDPNQTLTLNAPIANPSAGALTKNGGGSLQLGVTGALSAINKLTVLNGTLDLGASLGAGTQTVGAVTLTGGTVSDGALSGTSYLLNGPALVSASLQDSSTGATALTVNGGWSILSGANTYSGSTTLTSGTLQLGANGNSGSLGPLTSIALNNGTALIFNRGDAALQVTQPISGNGMVINSGSGAVTVSNSNGNTYSYGTIVNAGVLVSANDTALGSGVLGVNTGGTASLTSPNPTFPGITGNGVIVLGNSFSGSSNLTITGSGSNGFSGSILEAGNSGVLSTLTMAGSGSLVLSGSTSGYTGGTFLNNGTLTAYPGSVGSGKIALNGGNLITGFGGLQEGWFVGGNAYNTTGAFSTTTLQSVQSSPRAANWTVSQTASGSGVPNAPQTNFPDNTTAAYQGYMYFTPAMIAGGVSFYKNFDDSEMLVVNGGTLINDGQYNRLTQTYFSSSSSSLTVNGGTLSTSGAASSLNAFFPTTPGWYPISIRFGQGGGGVGPNLAGYTYGLGFDLNGNGGTLGSSYSFPSGIYATSTASATYSNNIEVDQSAQIAAASPALYNGNFNMLGGTLSLVGPSTHTIAGQLFGSGGLNVASVVTVTGSNNAFSGPLTVSASGALIAANASGSANGTGSTTLASGGTLSGFGILGASPGAGDITVQAGGTLRPHTNATGINTLTVASNLTLQANSILNFNLTPGASDQVNVGGTLTLPGAGQEMLNLNFINGAGTGTYQLFGVNTLSGSGSAFNFSADPPRFSYSVSTPNDGGPAGQVLLTVSAVQVYWTGSASTTWGLVADQNFNVNGSPAAYSAGLDTQFDDRGANNPNVQVALAGVQPNSVVFNNNAVPYSFSNAGGGTVGISGSGTVTVNGPGTVAFNSQNTYSGGTIFNGGVLTANGDSALGTAPASPATNLTFNGGALNISAATTLNANRSVLMTGNGTIGVPSAANTVSFAGQISGNGGLTATGPGTLSLGGSSPNFGGGITVSNGAVVAGTFGALGSGPVTLNNGGKLVLGAEGPINGFYGMLVSTNSNGTMSSGGTAVGGGGSLLTLTDPTGTFARSAWQAVPIAANFTATFTYQDVSKNGADGITFGLQDSSAGTIGTTGAGLGYGGIVKSGVVAIDIYDNGGFNSRTGFSTAGNVSTTNTTAPTVSMASGDPIAVSITYNQAAGTVIENLKDTVTLGTTSYTYTGVNFQTLLGSTTGYMGFTGATGGVSALQTISNFQFIGGLGPTSFANAVNVAAGASAELNLGTQLTNSMSVGNLTLNPGATLNVTRSGSTTPNAYYTVGASGTILVGGNAAIGVAYNGTGVGTFSPGLVTGTGPLTMAGPGVLSMTSSLSSYFGGTTINGGTVQVNNPASLGDPSGGVTINNGSLEVVSGFTTTRQLTFNAPAATLAVDAGQFYTNSTQFAAPGGTVTVTGGGTLSLGGTLLPGSANLVSGVGNFDLGGLTHSVSNASFTGGSVTDGALQATNYFVNGPAAVSAALLDNASPASLTVNYSGSGAASLTGTNTYSGGTVVSQGTLNAAPLSLGSNSITLAGGVFHPLGAAPGLIANFYKPDMGNAYASSYGSLTAWLANSSGTVTHPYSTTTTANGNTALNFNGPNGANGQAFNGTNGPGNIGYTDATGNNYSAVLNGYIYLNANQVYTFATRSDDGSMLFINGQTVVTNNAYQGMTTKSGTVSEATSGYYPIEAAYYQGTGGAGLEVFSDAGNTVMLNTQVSQTVPINNNIFPNSMAVTANSSLDMSNGLTVGFGTLTIGANTLHVTSGPGTANFPAAIISAAATFDVQGSNVLNLGQIYAATGFSTSGSGTLIVSAGSTANGAVTVNGGSLVAIQQGGDPAAGPLGNDQITLNNGTLVLVNTSTASTYFDPIDFSGNHTILSGTNDSIIAGSTLASAAASGGVANGNVTLGDTGTLAIVAGQTLNLGAVNGYTLNLSPSFSLSNSGTINVPAGSVTLTSSNVADYRGTFTAASGGSLTVLGLVTSGTYAPANQGTVTLGGTYSGLLANLVSGTGGILAVNQNTTSGTLNVTGGAYYATNPNSFGPTTLELNGGTLGATTALTGSNSLPNALVWASSAGGLINFGGNNNVALGAPLALSSGTYTINDPNTRGTFGGVISGTGSLYITGYPTLAGVNTYSGTTTLNGATNVTLTNPRGFGTGLINFNTGGFNGSAPLTGFYAVANPWTIPAGSAAYFNGTNAVQLSASTSLSGAETIHVASNLTATLSGLISGTGSLVRGTDNYNPAGTLVINNPLNNFSGGFTLNTQGNNVDVFGASTTMSNGTVQSGPLGTGTITIGTANNGNIGLNNSAPVAVTLGNNVNLFEDSGFNSPAGLNFTGTTTLTTGNAVYNFWIGANSNTRFSGVITGGTKGLNLRQGTGTGGLTLSNAGNNYTGPTSITMGTLIAGNNAPYSGNGVFGNSAGTITIGDGNSANTPAALMIGGPYYIDRAVTVNANAGPTTLGGTTSDNSTFGNLTQQPITLNKSVSLSAAANGTVNFYDNISGTGGITAASAPSGTVILWPVNPNTYTGATAVSSGQLTLEYSQASFPVSGNGALVLNGGQLNFLSDPADPISQTFASTQVAKFGSTVTASGGQTTNVALNGITRSGGVLDLPNNATFTTTNVNTNGIVGGYLTMNLKDWASVSTNDNTTIVPLSTNGGYTLSSTGGYTLNSNVDVDDLASAPLSSTTVNSLRFNSTPAGNLPLGGGTLTLQTGGILVTSSLANSVAITNGALTASGTTASNTLADVVVIQGSTTPFTIGASIVNNGTISVGLTKGGPGLLVLTAANTFTGPITISGGTLQGSIGVGSFPTNIALNAGAVVDFVENGAAPAASAITVTGSGSLVKDGSQGLTLSGALATGPLNVLNGGLTLSNNDSVLSLSGSGALNISAGDTLTENATANSQFSGPIGGAGSFTLSGPYNLTLTNSGSTLGGTVRSSLGTLQLNNASILQNATLDMNAADLGAVTFNGPTSLTLGGLKGTRNLAVPAGPLTLGGNGASTTYSGNLSGATSLTKVGSGTSLLTGVNSVGNTVITAGAMGSPVVGGLAASLPGSITLAGTGSNTPVLELASPGGVNYTATLGAAAGNIAWSGNGGFSANGGSAGVNLSGGATLVWGSTPNFLASAGTLVLGSPTATNLVDFQNSINLNGQSGQVYVQKDTASTTDWARLSGVISGAGPLVKSGPGLLALSNSSNSYSGGTIVNAGTLRLGSAGALAGGGLAANAGLIDLFGYSPTLTSLSGAAGNITNSGGSLATLTVNQAASTTFGGVISDGATNKVALAMSGGGQLVLTGASTYTAGTTVSGAGSTLLVNGALSSSGAVTVSSGGAFGGSGSAGNTTILNGGTLDLSRNGGGVALSLPSLTLGLASADASTIDFSSAQTTPELLITGSNGLTTNGGSNKVTVNIVGSPAVGTYTLATYSSLNGTGASAFNLTPPTLTGRETGATLSVSGNAIQMVVTGVSPVWTGANSGQWSGGNNWILPGGSVTDYQPGDTEIFDDSVGTTGPGNNPGFTTVSIVGSNVTPGSVTFNNNQLDYTIGGPFGIAGAASLTLNGSRNVTLTGPNSYSGPTIINAGMLEIGNGGAAGSLGSGNVADNGVLAFNLSSNYVVNNVISGSGSVVQYGAGMTTLGALNNSYSGGTTINGGTLAIAGDGALGSAPAAPQVNLTLSGGALNFTASTTISTNRTISLGAGGGTFNIPFQVSGGSIDGATEVNMVKFSGQITGPGGLTINGGAGSNLNAPGLANNPYLLVLNGTTSNYQGNTTINNATVTNDSTLVLGVNILPPTTVLTLTNSAIFGYWQGGASQTLAGLQGDSTTAIGTENNGTFSFLVINPALNQTYTYGGSIGDVEVAYRGHPLTGGAGIGLTISGQGTQVLTGSDLFTGGNASSVTITSGTLQLGNGGTSGWLAPNAPIVNNGALVFNRSNTVTQGTDFATAAITGNGSLVQAGSGNLVLNAGNTYGGPTTVSAGTLTAAAANALSANSDMFVGTGAAAATLDATAAGQTVKSLTVGPLGTLNLSVGNVLASNGDANFSAGSTLNISGNIITPETLMTYTGAESGSFGHIFNNGGTLPGGDSLTYTGGIIQVISGVGGFSGQGTWLGTSNSWNTNTNWIDGGGNNGIPGDGTRPAGSDTATFNGSGSFTTVTLDINPNVAGVTFSGPNYTLSGTLGGSSLTLQSNSGTASVTVLSGTHTIDSTVAVTLANNLSIAPAAGSELKILGDISESTPFQALALNDAGTLVLEGTNSYTGGTFVNKGTLVITTGGALANNTNLSVAAGGTFIYDPASPLAGTATSAASAVAGVPAVAGAPASVAAVPEPGTLALLLAGLVVGLGAAWRTRKGAKS